MKINSSDLTILLYHGVFKKKSKGVANFSGKHLFIDNFYNQMKVIKENYNILSINEIVELKKNKLKWGENSVAVTFDDGFKNNYKYALPILEELKIPTVFYICAGMIGSSHMFWVDIIEDCINRSKKKYIFLKLDKNYKFNILNKDEKIKTINKIKFYCKKIKNKIKNEVIQNLIEETNVIPDLDVDENYQIMNWNELKEISKNELFTIGGHTLYHDIMTSNPLSVIEKDIELTVKLLEFNLSEKIKHFSYPEGQEYHYNSKIINKLKKNNIICCPTAIKGANNFQSDLFNLKRIMPNFMGTKFPL